MLYFLSRSSNNGTLTIDVTFELGTNLDLATVQDAEQGEPRAAAAAAGSAARRA